MSSFEIGEDIQLRSNGGDRGCSDDDQQEDNVVIAEVISKVFKDDEGNYIEQTVSFNTFILCMTTEIECFLLFSGTSLIWTPLGQTQVSLIVRCP